eukprot:385741-Amorphochlora_amoeboformis.AAC.1
MKTRLGCVHLGEKVSKFTRQWKEGKDKPPPPHALPMLAFGFTRNRAERMLKKDEEEAGFKYFIGVTFPSFSPANGSFELAGWCRVLFLDGQASSSTRASDAS